MIPETSSEQKILALQKGISSIAKHPPVTEGKVLIKEMKIVKGAIQLIGPAGEVLLTSHNARALANGEMSAGSFTYNLVRTGSGLTVGYLAGIAVGAFFLIGESAYDNIQHMNRMRYNDPKKEIRSWGDFKRQWRAWTSWGAWRPY